MMEDDDGKLRIRLHPFDYCMGKLKLDINYCVISLHWELDICTADCTQRAKFAVL